jgi:hypothetical protein
MSDIESSNSEPKTRGGHRFQKGNPGKPKGARNRATQLVEKLLSKDIKKVVEVVQTAALNNDLVACKLILDRVAPPARGRLVAFDLPSINSAADGEAAIAAILAACGAGKLTPDEAKTLSDIVHRKVETAHMAEVERRLEVLEKPTQISSYRKVA